PLHSPDVSRLFEPGTNPLRAAEGWLVPPKLGNSPPNAGGRPEATFWIGTSGWQYDSWKGRFYPRNLPKNGWLAFYSERFATVEVNNSFYRLPSDAAFERW